MPLDLRPIYLRPIYLRPTTLDDALAALADPALTMPPDPNERLTILAGGTDFYPARTTRLAWMQPTPRNILDISAIPGLRGVRRDGGDIVFGALTTWTDIIEADLPPAFDALKQSARQVGGLQVQNRGTIAGNLCNASPAADGGPPLLALDAWVEIAGARGARTVSLTEFTLGNRNTALAPDEMVVAIAVPDIAPSARSVFLKLGARAYLVISIASVAAVIDCDADGMITRAAIAVGACAAVPQRLTGLERALKSVPLSRAGALVEEMHLDALAPIDDIRASATYRRAAATTIVRRALAELSRPAVISAAASLTTKSVAA